jgi:hypothetical protein
VLRDELVPVGEDQYVDRFMYTETQVAQFRAAQATRP